MKFYTVNGSPRKKHNTGSLLAEAAKGILSVHPHAKVESIHLYDLRYTGCRSCFACKKLGGSHYGTCAVKDDISPILRDMADADGIIFGSPVYLSSITGEMRSFLERILFQYYVYDMEGSSLAPKKMPTAFIYTMNLPKEIARDWGYPKIFADMEGFIEKVLSKPHALHAYNTYQFDDYSKYKMIVFSEAEKAAYRAAQFPKDLEKAFALGAAIAAGVKA